MKYLFIILLSGLFFSCHTKKDIYTSEYNIYCDIMDRAIELTRGSQKMTSKFIQLNMVDSALFYLGRSYATQELAEYYQGKRKEALSKANQ